MLSGDVLLEQKKPGESGGAESSLSQTNTVGMFEESVCVCVCGVIRMVVYEHVLESGKSHHRALWSCKGRRYLVPRSCHSSRLPLCGVSILSKISWREKRDLGKVTTM